MQATNAIQIMYVIVNVPVATFLKIFLNKIHFHNMCYVTLNIINLI